MQISKVTSEHQCQQALDADAKRCASRFVHEERHVTTIQRKLQTLSDQQQAAINSKVCIIHSFFSVLLYPLYLSSGYRLIISSFLQMTLML